MKSKVTAKEEGGSEERETRRSAVTEEREADRKWLDKTETNSATLRNSENMIEKPISSKASFSKPRTHVQALKLLN